MINFKVGILGAGAIAEKIADTLNRLDSFEVYAIASRDIEKANAFGDKYSVGKRYGSYEELIQDTEVEMVYIATPHSNHAELARKCIEAGRPCLVEKAFSYNAQTTEEVLKLSEEKNVFCAEAMWIRYMPIYKFLHDKLREGIIGDVQHIECSLGYDIRDKERIVKPELAGGALLDLGVYPLNVFAMLFQMAPENMIGSCLKLSTGVDAQFCLTSIFPKGKVGTAFVTTLFNADNGAKIYGNKGYITIDNINCPSVVKIYMRDGKLAGELNINERQISGYEHEFLAAREAIITGKVETVEMPHSESIRIMKLCDNLRDAWSIKFPMEQ